MMNFTKEYGRFYTYTEWKRGKTNREIHEALVEVWKDSAPGYSTIKRWTANVTCEKQMSFEDAPRSGRPVSVTTDISVDTVRGIVTEDPHLSTRAIAEKSGISHPSVWRILTTELQMRRLAAYWVPQNLTEEQRMKRVNSAQAIRNKLVAMGEERYRRYVVEDESWFNFDVQHTSTTASQWVSHGMPRPKAVCSKLTPRKCLVMVAFSACKRFNVQALPYGETINGDVYMDFVKKTGKKWQCVKKNPIHLHQVIWQHDNARPHTKQEVVSFFNHRKIENLHQAPYSPDLNLCDRWLFAHLKKTLRIQQFQSYKEVEAAIVKKLKATDENEFKRQIDLLMMHCERIVAVCGDYYVPEE